MRICIVGCGAIGSVFAAHLAQLPELEVWAYDTSAAHVDAINRDGLRIVGRTDLVAPHQRHHRSRAASRRPSSASSP